jgi:hypothetical protein
MSKALESLYRYLEDPFSKNTPSKNPKDIFFNKNPWTQFQSGAEKPQVYSDPIEDNIMNRIITGSIVKNIENTKELLLDKKPNTTHTGPIQSLDDPQLSDNLPDALETIDLLLLDLRYIFNTSIGKDNSKISNDKNFVDSGIWIPLIDLLFNTHYHAKLSEPLKTFYADKLFITHLWIYALDKITFSSISEKNDPAIITILMLLDPHTVENNERIHKGTHLGLIKAVEQRNVLTNPEKKHFALLKQLFNGTLPKQNPQVKTPVNSSWWEYFKKVTIALFGLGASYYAYKYLQKNKPNIYTMWPAKGKKNIRRTFGPQRPAKQANAQTNN